MAYEVLAAEDAFWRPSNQMGVQNTDLGKQLGAEMLGMRLWRIEPGQASTRHRHLGEEEIYLLLEGTGRMRVGEDLLTLKPFSAVRVGPEETRQIFNDTDAGVLWLVAGAPPEFSSSLELTDEVLAKIYPDGAKALPPEIQ